MKEIADISKKSKLYQDVNKLIKPILTGKVLVIDPSIGSNSSSPGWAIYSYGELVDSGSWHVGGSSVELWKRARKLGDYIKFACAMYSFDLLIYEDIPATSSFNQNAVASLLKSVGVVLSCSRSEYVLGIHPASWRNYVRPGYKKGDKEDAEEIGHIAISLARHIIGENRATEGDSSNGSPLSRRSKKTK